MGIYADKNLYDWFVSEYGKRCKYKLDMGKSCIRLNPKKDIPYQVFKDLSHKISAQEWINIYEETFRK
jgi:hypothetical protein